MKFTELSIQEAVDIIYEEARRLHNLSKVKTDMSHSDELQQIHHTQYVALVNVIKSIASAETAARAKFKATPEEELAVAS